MEDGSNTHIVLQKNSQYACPLYCDVDHIHHAVVCKDKTQINDNKFVYHISEKNENGIFQNIKDLFTKNGTVFKFLNPYNCINLMMDFSV